MVLRHFQHYIGYFTTGSFVGRGNQCIQLVKILYCKLPTIMVDNYQLSHIKVQGLNCQPQRWEASLLPLRDCGPHQVCHSCSYWAEQTPSSHQNPSFRGHFCDWIANKVQAKVVYFYYKTIIDVLSNIHWFCLFSILFSRLRYATMFVDWNSVH